MSAPRTPADVAALKARMARDVARLGGSAPAVKPRAPTTAELDALDRLVAEGKAHQKRAAGRFEALGLRLVGGRGAQALVCVECKTVVVPLGANHKDGLGLSLRAVVAQHTATACKGPGGAR